MRGIALPRRSLRQGAQHIAMPQEFADVRGAIDAVGTAEDEFGKAREAFVGFAVRTVGAKLPNA
jgi:hypothetical protein